MKKTVSFDLIKKSGYQGLKGAVSVAFPSHFHMQIIDGTGLPYGAVSIDGEEWDWILVPHGYQFIRKE